MGHYRNRRDRRVAGPNPVQPIINPIMNIGATSVDLFHVQVEFDQDIAAVNLADPDVLTSVYTWIPSAGYEGHAIAAVLDNPNTITFQFAGSQISGDDACIVFLDGHNHFRGLLTGARCTGNPAIFTGA